MRILSVTAQKVDSTGSGVFLSELTGGFRKLGIRQAVVCGTVSEDRINLEPDIQLFPVVFKTPDLPFPICGMSDEMPYESTRYCDLNEEMSLRLMDAFRSTLREAVASFQPDVILCHHLYFLAALIREMFPDIPVYGQCHGSDLRQIRKNSWQRDWITSQIRKLDGVFALHTQQKETIGEIFGIPENRIYVLGTGYNSDVFHLDEEVKRQHTGKIRLIFAGKLSEKKGLFSLLRAMKLLREPQRYELILAGGWGNEAEYAQIRCLAEQAPCSVTFAGKLTHQQLAQEMNQSDIFILPSFYEGLPLVLIEAMACGLKTVCTDLPGIRPWLDAAIPDNGTIFVAPPRMHNEDEPFTEDLPLFEERLRDAIEAANNQPAPKMELVRQLSWDGLCKKYCTIWNY